MSALSKASPLKRKPAENSKPPAKPKTALEPGNPLWLCLDAKNCPEGRIAVRTKRDGKHYGTCDKNNWKDPDTCKVTCSYLAPSKDHPHNCQLCLQDVGGKPSIGIPTDEIDDRGYKVWENYCAVFGLCTGAKTQDGGTFKNATAATGDIVGKRCFSSKDSHCAGKIKAGELVVKDWIVSIRAEAESIEVEPEALTALGKIGAKTSLRYAVQMLTPGRILAETSGRTKINTGDVEEVDALFHDAKASAQRLTDDAEGYLH